jgi:uncharacterized protein YjaG (DUF416 family)
MLEHFTISDRMELQDWLDLPIHEADEWSTLYRLLYECEERDRREGTAYVARVKLLMGKIRTLSTSEDAVLETGNLNKKRQRVDAEYDIEWATPGGQADAFGQAKQKFVEDIKLILGYRRRLYGNRLRRSWPNGGLQSSEFNNPPAGYRL